MESEQKRVLPNPLALICFCTAATIICYADRSNISSAIITMGDEFNWNLTRQGFVLSSFFIGYCISIILGGFIADAFGGRHVLTTAVVVWSIFTFLTPLAAKAGFGWLIICRVGLGLGEGVSFPAVHSMVSQFVPKIYHSTAAATATGGIFFGSLFAYVVAPEVIDHLGWEYSFYIFACLAVVWVPLWLSFDPATGRCGNCFRRSRSAPTPDQSAVCDAQKVVALCELERERSSLSEKRQGTFDASDQDRAWDVEDLTSPRMLKNSSIAVADVAKGEAARLPEDGGSKATWESSLSHESSKKSTFGNRERQSSCWSRTRLMGRRMYSEVKKATALKLLWHYLGYRPVWGIIVAQFACNWGVYGLVNWLPTFMSKAHDIDMKELPIYTAAPYLAQGIVAILSGPLADYLIQRKKYRVVLVRRWMLFVGMVFPAVFLLLAVETAKSAATASLMVTIGTGVSAVSCGSLAVNQLDVAPNHAGFVYAVGLTAGVISGLICVPINGHIFDTTGSWDIVFGTFSGVYLLGGIAWILLVGADKLPEPVL